MACVAAYATSLAIAQTADKEAPPPPQMQKLEEGEEPAITIRKPETKSQITEKRAPGGKVTEMKVTRGKNAYYLKPNDQVGSVAPGDTQSTPNRGAQWEVKEFDLGRKGKKEKAEEAAQNNPASPAANPPPRKK